MQKLKVKREIIVTRKQDYTIKTSPPTNHKWEVKRIGKPTEGESYLVDLSGSTVGVYIHNLLDKDVGDDEVIVYPKRTHYADTGIPVELPNVTVPDGYKFAFYACTDSADHEMLSAVFDMYAVYHAGTDCWVVICELDTDMRMEHVACFVKEETLAGKLDAFLDDCEFATSMADEGNYVLRFEKDDRGAYHAIEWGDTLDAANEVIDIYVDISGASTIVAATAVHECVRPV